MMKCAVLLQFSVKPAPESSTQGYQAAQLETSPAKQQYASTIADEVENRIVRPLFLATSEAPCTAQVDAL